jgi:hypothetical protein
MMMMPLLVGAGMVLVTVFSYAMTTALILHLLLRLVQSGYTGLSFWKDVVVMMIVSLLMATSHVVQIALWAVVFLLVGEMSTFEAAFYYSAENYTALGYGDITLSARWRLLGPLEAINGLLLFGLSTASMFAVLSRLITARLHLNPGSNAQE